MIDRSPNPDVTCARDVGCSSRSNRPYKKRHRPQFSIVASRRSLSKSISATSTPRKTLSTVRVSNSKHLLSTYLTSKSIASMSGFLYRLPTTITPLARSTFTRQAPRAFSVSFTQREKTATDAVKEPLKKVDRAVSDTIVKGIDSAGKILNVVSFSTCIR